MPVLPYAGDELEAVPGNPILDLSHLEAQTAGDQALARDLLRLFDAQCVRLGPALAGQNGRSEQALAAHTLLGAARAVGAGEVSAAAERLEAAPASAEIQPGDEITAAIARVRARLASLP